MIKINYKILAFFLYSTFIFAQEKEEIIIENPPVSPDIRTIGEEDVQEIEDHIPFSILEVIPNFETCKDLTNQEAKTCFQENMNKHIIDNFRYPKEALKAKIEGRVLVMFVINKEGEVENIKTKGPINGSLLEQEAKRIIEALPKFSPGKMRDKTINVAYAQPITFKL